MSDNNTILLLPKLKYYNYIFREGIPPPHFYKRDSQTIYSIDEAFKAVNFTLDNLFKKQFTSSDSETDMFLADSQTTEFG